MKVYRQVRTSQLPALAALEHCLQGYQPPVPEQVLRQQMIIAIREATDISFVPPSLRGLASEVPAP